MTPRMTIARNIPILNRMQHENIIWIYREVTTLMWRVGPGEWWATERIQMSDETLSTF